MSERDIAVDVIYDETYSHLQEIVERSQKWLPRLKDAFLAYSEVGRPLELSTGNTLLDIGCGVGRPGHYLRHQGVQTFNVDINPAAHMAARQLWKGRDQFNSSVVGDGSIALPFADHSIDAICSQDYFEHITPHRLDDALDEMGRVLKGDKMVHRITVLEEPENLYGDPTHQTFWSVRQWSGWFQDHGWETVAPSTRKIYAPRADKFGFTPYCHGYFLLKRKSPIGSL